MWPFDRGGDHKWVKYSRGLRGLRGFKSVKSVVILTFPVLPLFVPRHLNSLEFLLVGVLRIVLKFLETCHPLEQVGKTHSKRIGVGELVGQSNSHILRIRPGQRSIHWISLTRLSLSAFEMAAFMISSAKCIVALLNRSMACRIT